MQMLFILLMSFPAVTIALLVGALGLVLRHWAVVFAGALLAGPFFLYLALGPGLRLVAPFAWALYVLAAGATAWNEKARSRAVQLVAWLLFVPSVSLVIWLRIIW